MLLVALRSLNRFQLHLVHLGLGLSLINQDLDIEKVLMLEHIFLGQIVYLLVQVVKDLWVSEVHDVLDKPAILNVNLHRLIAILPQAWTTWFLRWRVLRCLDLLGVFALHPMEAVTKFVWLLLGKNLKWLLFPVKMGKNWS